jgi:hypothetical protein
LQTEQMRLCIFVCINSNHPTRGKMIIYNASS